MKAILNTTFFFSAAVGDKLRSRLKARWLPACACSGVDAPLCLAMEPEQSIERLAVQTCFADRDAAQHFLDEVAAPLAAQLTEHFGADSMTAFSTIMDIVEL